MYSSAKQAVHPIEILQCNDRPEFFVKKYSFDKIFGSRNRNFRSAHFEILSETT